MSRKLIIISVSLLFVLVGTFTAFPQQAQDKSQFQQKEIGKSDENFPIISLDDSAQLRGADETRTKKNQKFDNSRWVERTVDPSVVNVGNISHWQLGLPALPVQKSDAVLVGVVKSAEAFLSNDKTGVYSEFSVAVDNLIKNNQLQPIEQGANITVQRAGGRILYPTGRVVKYSVSGQDMPRLNGEYVFFLAFDQQRDTYRIITGYEISNGTIAALDGKGRSKESGFLFSQYDGMKEQKFMNEVQNALHSQNPSSEEATAP